LTQEGADNSKKDNPRKRPEKPILKQHLIDHGGVVSKVAKALGVSRQSIYDWIEFYDKGIKTRDATLMSIVDSARMAMYDMAADNILRIVETEGDDNHYDASKFVLTHMPVKHRDRWTNRTELTGKDGTPLNVSPELAKLMEKLSISPDELVAQLETLLREQVGE
jgi:hypothetical protein